MHSPCYYCNKLDLFFIFSSSHHLQSILNEDDNSHVLQNLDPDTEYDVTVTAIYPDESESEDLMGMERTCKQAVNTLIGRPASKKQPSCFTLTDVTLFKKK